MSNQRHEQDDDRSVVRQQNRALRSINRKLRAQVRRMQEQADNVFQTILETQTEAELAFSNLWASGHFDCGSQDYEFMVQETIKAFEKVKQLDKPRRRIEIPGDKPKRKFTDS